MISSPTRAARSRTRLAFGGGDIGDFFRGQGERGDFEAVIAGLFGIGHGVGHRPAAEDFVADAEFQTMFLLLGAFELLKELGNARQRCEVRPSRPQEANTKVLESRSARQSHIAAPGTGNGA